jgi:hypothetical protein
MGEANKTRLELRFGPRFLLRGSIGSGIDVERQVLE